jgi:hypothetical protein
MRVSRWGVLVLVILVSGALLAVFGSGKVAGFGIVVAALVLLGVAGQGIGGGGAGDYGRKGEVLREHAEADRQRRQARRK